MAAAGNPVVKPAAAALGAQMAIASGITAVAAGASAGSLIFMCSSFSSGDLLGWNARQQPMDAPHPGEQIADGNKILIFGLAGDASLQVLLDRCLRA
jgi:hypothetical protein